MQQSQKILSKENLIGKHLLPPNRLGIPWLEELFPTPSYYVDIDILSILKDIQITRQFIAE